jgi:undecaprenyl-diphosphatase
MIPAWLQAVVLGIVQGLTEFVPVSSSGHLVLVPYLAGWEHPGLAFDVALHIGTAGAIVLYFRRELLAMARGVLTRGDSPDNRLYRRLAVLFLVASVPIGIVGLTLRETFEEAFATPPVAAALLFVTASILVGGERWRARRVRTARVRARGGSPAPAGGVAAPSTAPAVHALPLGDDPEDPDGRTLDRVGLRQALWIGAAQCLALFPGVSRSGTTIMAGVAAGLTRQAATRFSFLLALPALAGAGILSLPDLTEPGMFAGREIAVGVMAAFVSSYLAIRFLVAFVSRQRLNVFAAYCVVAGVVALGTFVLRG